MSFATILKYKLAVAGLRTVDAPLANALRSFAVFRQAAGDGAAARRLWREAHDLYVAVGVQAGVDESAKRLAQLA